MNAYELADIVDKWAYKESAEYLTDAATLIRQQADRIRNLEKTLGFKNSGYETINLTPKLDLTDEEIEQVRVAIMGVAYWCADENMPEAYNAIKVCCAQVLGILVKAQEK